MGPHLNYTKKLWAMILMDLYSAQEVAQKLGVSPSAVKMWHRRYRLHGRESLRRSDHRFPKNKERNQIIIDLRKRGLSLAEIAPVVGLSRESIRRIVSDAGVPHPRRGPKTKFSDDIVSAALQMYKNHSRAEVSKVFGCHPYTVERWAKMAKNPRANFGNSKKTER